MSKNSIIFSIVIIFFLIALNAFTLGILQEEVRHLKLQQQSLQEEVNVLKEQIQMVSENIIYNQYDQEVYKLFYNKELSKQPTIASRKKPKYVSSYSYIPWEDIFTYASGTDPILIAAIGMHETKWGTHPNVKHNYQLGYGIGNKKYEGHINQIKYTSNKMIAWGITKDASLENLRLGNKGVLPTGYYAEDKQWPDKVYEWYKILKRDLKVYT